MKKAKGILFKGAMVRAILEDRKTQTRRLMKPQPVPNGTWIKSIQDFRCICDYYPPSATLWKGGMMGGDAGEIEFAPYSVGDLLYVKETFTLDFLGPLNKIVFRADNPIGNCRWKPSIFMPRNYSRITLEVTEARVQRLQEISEEDCIAEGIEEVKSAGGCRAWKDYQCDAGCCEDPRNSYCSLWESINGEGSWTLNPWVFVYDFKRITPQVMEQI